MHTFGNPVLVAVKVMKLIPLHGRHWFRFFTMNMKLMNELHKYIGWWNKISVKHNDIFSQRVNILHSLLQSASLVTKSIFPVNKLNYWAAMPPFTIT
jgi:hypothetical protein